MDPSFHCLICADSITAIILGCNCQICSNCLGEWTNYHAQEHFLTGDKTIRCPNEFCDKKYSVDLLLPKLSSEQCSAISDILLRNYMIRAPDIVNCQRGSCKYYGIIIPERCSSELICELCGYKWTERSQMSTLETIFVTVADSGSIISELQTTLYHLQHTVECPQCSIAIRKVGGCSHMTCKKCSYEFCWDCKQEYTRHSKNHCLANQYAKNSGIGFVVFYLAILMGLHVVFWAFWIGMFRLILKLLLLNSAFLVLFLLIYPILRIIREEESIFQNRVKSVWFVTWFSVMAYITFQHIEYLINNYLKELIWATCVEIVLAWMVRSMDFLVQTWLKHVF